jgi:hypothetical protein
MVSTPRCFGSVPDLAVCPKLSLTFPNFIINDVYDLLPLKDRFFCRFREVFSRNALTCGLTGFKNKEKKMISANALDCRVQMTLKEDSRLRFLLNGVFCQGVRVEIISGSSIRQVIVDQIGIAEDYLENRVQTLFLNGKPVDDVDAMKVSDGSILALSAAMPGLAGATLRKGGKYAAFRQQISFGSDSPVPVLRKGKLVLKLFNLVAEEQGPSVLIKGIGISGADLLDVIRKAQNQTMLQEILKVEVNGNAIAPEMLAEEISSKAAVFLSII